jgi:hypothetical protein
MSSLGEQVSPNTSDDRLVGEPTSKKERGTVLVHWFFSTSF